jgi:ABC-2 type transport system permease protein
VTTSVVGRLVRKDVYLVRWLAIGSLVAGLVSVAIMPLGAVTAYVGGVSLVCVIVILNIMLVMANVVQERKDKVLLFIVSLPISTSQYTLAKVTANVIVFGISWLVLSAAALVVIDRSAIPNGWIPFLVVVLVYLLAYYCVLLGVAVASDSSGWHAAVITLGNISVNFLIPFLMGMPSIGPNVKSASAVWAGDIVAIIAFEFAVGVAALAAGLYVRSRARDFV